MMNNNNNDINYRKSHIKSTINKIFIILTYAINFYNIIFVIVMSFMKYTAESLTVIWYNLFWKQKFKKLTVERCFKFSHRRLKRVLNQIFRLHFYSFHSIVTIVIDYQTCQYKKTVCVFLCFMFSCLLLVRCPRFLWKQKCCSLMNG